MNDTVDRAREPRRHFDIQLTDGSLFPAVGGADELDAAAWLGAQLGHDVGHLVHDAIPVSAPSRCGGAVAQAGR